MYDHVRGRGRTSKRWIRYDGAPEDVLFAVPVGVPLVAVLEGPFRWMGIGALSVSVTYGLLRRRLAALALVVVARVPEVVATLLPERYRQ